MRLAIYLVVGSLLAGTASLAENVDAVVNAIHNECGEREGFPRATASCIREKEDMYGRLLARAYDLALSVPYNDASLLRESQRHWLKYQETSCELELKRRKSSVFANSSHALCLLRTTLNRLEELKGLTERPEE